MFRIQLAFIALLQGAGITWAATVACMEAGNGWDPARAIAYLELSREQQSDGCTITALEPLSDPGASPDPRLLLRYVTLLRPAEGFRMITIGSVERLYPAVAALVRVGDSALPTLVEALGDESNPEQVVRNVLRTMKLILGNDSVALLRLLRDGSRDAAGAKRTRLIEAAELATLWCSSGERESCAEILSDTASIRRPDDNGSIR